MAETGYIYAGHSSYVDALTADDNYYFANGTLALGNDISAVFQVNAAEAEGTVAVVTIGDKTFEYNVTEMQPREGRPGRYYFTFSHVSASALDATITCQLFRDGAQVGVTYSVTSYVFETQDSTDLALQELVRTMYNYGESTKNYVNSL